MRRNEVDRSAATRTRTGPAAHEATRSSGHSSVPESPAEERIGALQAKVDRSPLLLAQRARMPVGDGSPSPVVQRAVSNDDWQNRILPAVSRTAFAQVTRDADNALAFLRVAGGGGFEIRHQGDAGWAAITAPAFQAGYTWGGKIRHGGANQESNMIDLAEPAALHSNIDPAAETVPMNVQDVEDDRYGLIHHSYSTYKTPAAKNSPAARREAGHHLTVENAHLLLLHTLADDHTGAHVDKRTMDKPGVNTSLKARGVTEVDNLNFFPRPGAQAARPLGLGTDALPTKKLPESADPGAEPVDESLSLQDYVAFLQRSVASVANVPAVYGQKILQSAAAMQRLTGLDPAQLFLKVGKGDQRQVVRAVVSVALKGGIAGNLAIPVATLDVFRRYVTSAPELPRAEPVADDTEWVAAGALAQDHKTHYNELESEYVEQHYPAVVQALRAFIA